MSLKDRKVYLRRVLSFQNQGNNRYSCIRGLLPNIFFVSLRHLTLYFCRLLSYPRSPDRVLWKFVGRRSLASFYFQFDVLGGSLLRRATGMLLRNASSFIFPVPFERRDVISASLLRWSLQ